MKPKNIIITIITALVIFGLILAGFFLLRPKTSDDASDSVPSSEQDSSETDAARFASEYGISEDNLFVYRNADEIIKILEHGTGIVFLGFPECQWCRAYAPMLNDIAKANRIDKIYYYNISDDRRNNTETYRTLLSLLGDNLLYDEEGNHRIYVPDVSFILNGQILAHDNETSVMKDNRTPDEYWTPEAKSALTEKLTDYIKLIQTDANCETTCDA